MHQRARIEIPWNLTLHDRACLGDRANAYSLGQIEIGARATIAQEVYLDTGSHDFAKPGMPLVTAKITIGEDAFIGARAFVLPGVTIGARSVIGACSVVTKDVPENVIAAGNPCQVLRTRFEAPKKHVFLLIVPCWHRKLLSRTGDRKCNPARFFGLGADRRR